MRLLLSTISDGASGSLYDKDDSLRVMRSVAAVTTRVPDKAQPELNSRRVILALGRYLRRGSIPEDELTQPVLLVAFVLLALSALDVWVPIRYRLWNKQLDRKIAHQMTDPAMG